MKIKLTFLVLISLFIAQKLVAQINYITSSTSSTQSTLNLFHNSELKLGNTYSITDRARCILKFGDGDYVKIGEWEGDDWLSFKASRFNFTGSLFVNSGNIYVANSGFLSSNGTTGSVRLFYTDQFRHTYIDYSGNAYFRVTNVGTLALVLESTGNVGVGYTTSYTPGATHVPTGYKLGVNGNVICESLTANQKVGIGMAPPAVGNYNLYVKGGILTEEVKVQLQANWPDYVFAKDYKLSSLKEVETFISKNQHLPDLPSAENVKQDGINLGEMNSILLKKIEELTLYVIELEKKYVNLESRVTAKPNK